MIKYQCSNSNAKFRALVSDCIYLLTMGVLKFIQLELISDSEISHSSVWPTMRLLKTLKSGVGPVLDSGIFTEYFHSLHAVF